MRILRDHGHEPDDEVEELRWVAPADALTLLSYDHDKQLVSDL